MVARNTDAEVRGKRPSDGVVGRLLVWWQRLLSGLLGRTTSLVDTARRRSEKPAHSPHGAIAIQSPIVAWVGCLAVAFGALGIVTLAGSGTDRWVGVSGATMTIVWAGVRWALMDVVARRETTLTRAQVRGAWAVGALVWLIGVTPELRALAWVASGAVTWLILERLGATRRQALTCVGIAWGSQALVVVGSWLAKGALIAILATRG